MTPNLHHAVKYSKQVEAHSNSEKTFSSLSFCGCFEGLPLILDDTSLTAHFKMEAKSKEKRYDNQHNGRCLVAVALCLSIASIILTIACGFVVMSTNVKCLEFESKLKSMEKQRTHVYKPSMGNIRSAQLNEMLIDTLAMGRKV